MYCYGLSRTEDGPGLDGEGPAKNPGRWNTAGTPMVYFAESAALAALELLAHLDPAEIGRAFQLHTVELPDELVRTADWAKLPTDWRAIPVPQTTQVWGTAWAQGNDCLALRVPSVLVTPGWNVLLNPRHPQYGEVRLLTTAPFQYDARLLKR